MIEETSPLWQYLSPDMRVLVRDGEFLIEDSIRHTWKEGRNLVFHYFPHNYRSLTRTAAVELVNQLIGTMSEAVLILAPKEAGRVL